MNQILTILSSVGFNWHVALANFFNFLIILFLLNKFFFRKIGTTINERHGIIEKGINQAREGEKILASAKEEKASIIKDARKERDVIVAQGEALARDLALTIELEAQSSITRRMEELDAQEEDLVRSVEKEFALQAPHLVAMLYAKTLMKEMTEESNNALITRMNIQ